MKLTPPVRILLAVVMGIVVGLLMATVILYQPCRDFVDTIPGFMPLYGVIHIPAKLMAESWHALHLPPHGDGALFLYPRAVVIQWSVFGILIGGLFLRRRGQRRSEPDHGH